jgi:hypothetical protein
MSAKLDGVSALGRSDPIYKSENQKRGARQIERPTCLCRRKRIAKTTKETEEKGSAPTRAAEDGPIKARTGKADEEEQTEIRRSKNERNREFKERRGKAARRCRAKRACLLTGLVSRERMRNLKQVGHIATWKSQRIEECFVQDPEGELESLTRRCPGEGMEPEWPGRRRRLEGHQNANALRGARTCDARRDGTGGERSRQVVNGRALCYREVATDRVREADWVRAIRSNDRTRSAGWTASGAGRVACDERRYRM